MPTCLRPSSVYALVLLMTLAWPAAAVAADWKPIAPAELALKSPKVQPDADAEALAWDVRVADRMDVDYDLTFTTTFEHYLRIKVFTDRGRDALATVDIPFVSGIRVRDIAARTTKPDGTTLELKKADIYERTVVKANDLKVRAVSFAVPGIQTGAIVEYRWSEVHDDSLVMNLSLPFSREIPAHLVRYYLEPLPLGRQIGLRTLSFNGEFTAPERQKDGSWMVSLANVPADRSEPYDTPILERAPWLFAFYAERSAPSGKEMWQQFAKDLHGDSTRRAKVNDDIRRIATEAVTGASTTADRIQALVRVARARVRRIDVDTASPEDRRKAKENKTAADALKRGAGNGEDVLLLFVALANAAGMEARVAASPNRARLFHSQRHEHSAFLGGRVAVVRGTDGWIPVDPANEYGASGGLRWFYEKQELLVADPRDIVSVHSPLTPPAGSRKQRVGTFKLTEDGTLEGECRLEFTGHWAEIFREQDDQDTPAEREKSLGDLVVKRLPGAEVTEVKVDMSADPGAPYVNSYKLRIPGYAQRTGARLFFQPSVFQKGIEALFPSESRTSPVYFEFPWSEDDQVTIELPPGFALEQPQRPAPLNAGAATYDVWLGTEDAWRHLVLKRSLAVGLKHVTEIPPAGYRAVRSFFTTVHENDAHTLVLRREGTK
jgi:hypothetical protein